MAARGAGRPGKKGDNAKKVPELGALLEARDYLGAITLLG